MKKLNESFYIKHKNNKKTKIIIKSAKEEFGKIEGIKSGCIMWIEIPEELNIKKEKF